MMSTNNELFDKTFDLMLKEASVIAENEIINENSEYDEAVAFSDEHIAKMKLLLKIEQRKERRKSFIKYAKSIACVFIAFVFLSGLTIFSVDAWRERFMNFVFETKNPNTEINFRDDKGTVYANDIIQMDYIPMGFKMTKDKSDDEDVILHFKFEEQYFSYSTCNIDTDITIDTENATIEDINLNGLEGIYSSNSNINILLWHDNEIIYKIMGNIDKNDMLKIAESAKLLK